MKFKITHSVFNLMAFYFFNLVAHQDSRLKEIYDAWKQEGAHVPITVRLGNFQLLQSNETISCLWSFYLSPEKNKIRFSDVVIGYRKRPVAQELVKELKPSRFGPGRREKITQIFTFTFLCGASRSFRREQQLHNTHHNNTNGYKGYQWQTTFSLGLMSTVQWHCFSCYILS